MSMDLVHAKRVIEGLLFVLGQPVPLKRIKGVLEEGLDPQHLRGLIEQLNAEYVQTQRALRIQEVAGGYQLVTDPQLAPWMKRGFEAPRDVLSKPALETAAIIAYRQPLTKADIETLRGVDVTGTLETLLERRLVRVVGRKDTPGRPLLYGTTNEFLRRFGLKSLDDLPPLIPPPAASRQLVAGSAPTAQALRAAAGGGMTQLADEERRDAGTVAQAH